MQLKVWFFAGHDIANTLLEEGDAGDTIGLPRLVLTPLIVVDVVVVLEAVVEVVVVDVVSVSALAIVFVV